MPGVGAFGSAIAFLEKTGYKKALIEYIKNDGHFFGICIGIFTIVKSNMIIIIIINKDLHIIISYNIIYK